MQRMPQSDIPFLLRPIARLGDTGLYVLRDLGRMGIFLLFAVAGLFKHPFRWREVVKQLSFIGAGSIAVIFFTALSSGMVLGLQGYYSLHKFGAEGMLGSAVSLTLIMELGPILTALMVTGRAGSAMCAEIGIMRISEQIDALECMGIDPHRFLIAPKIIAGLLSVPVLTSIFDMVGILGGYLVGVVIFGLSEGAYFDSMAAGVEWNDVAMGLYKSILFGLVITWIATAKGYFLHLERGGAFGAEGVSRVTTDAVVLSAIAILFGDYLIGAVML